MFEYFGEYCKGWIQDWVESTAGYNQKNWETLQEELKTQFKDQDSAQQFYSLRNVEKLACTSAADPT